MKLHLTICLYLHKETLGRYLKNEGLWKVVGGSWVGNGNNERASHWIPLHIVSFLNLIQNKFVEAGNSIPYSPYFQIQRDNPEVCLKSID